MEIRLEPFGFKEFHRAVDSIADRAADPRRALEAIADSYQRLEEEVFGGDPDLVDTGSLRDSLTRRSAPGGVREVSGDDLAVGTAVGHARYHSARLLAPFTDEVAGAWADLLGHWIETGDMPVRLAGGIGL